ncbi:hypothetical protein EXIGLDRAFT_780385 [Exidia glandulosa HHB12029]|uniref:Uncharacterized protein n=1 Tax=Exidia glandulosa HHB12029 TaxID=1314781 RepID=A0A165BM45_EXIGL|nr:hypothetical protein EXIGLDRAFT_780385 [Exidia glandulosa HHB12029]
MVVLNEKETQIQPPAVPLHSPPPYAASPDIQQQYLLHLQQQHQVQAQQLQLQQQLAALHSRSRASPSRSSTSPLTPSFPAPAYSTFTQLSGVPPGVMLKIVYATFPEPGTDPTFVRLRRTLFWLAMNLRAVNKAFYVACMHVLRSSYLPAYTQNVRAPYTSDPFPSSSSAGAGEQRETVVLDRWMLLKVREDVLADESELHLDLDAQRDVFDMLQPRARTEDLIRTLGLRERVITLDNATARPEHGLYPFTALSVVFEPRRIALVLATKGGWRRTIAEVPRTREEALESSARKIVAQLVRDRR